MDPIKISLFLLHDNETIIFEILLVLGMVIVFSLSNLSFQIIINPARSPEIKDFVSFLLQIEETDPLCPNIDFTHFSFSQKYIDPFPIPETIYFLLSPLYSQVKDKRHNVGDTVKSAKSPLFELSLPFSYSINKIYFNVARTSFFSLSPNFKSNGTLELVCPNAITPSSFDVGSFCFFYSFAIS